MTATAGSDVGGVTGGIVKPPSPMVGFRKPSEASSISEVSVVRGSEAEGSFRTALTSALTDVRPITLSAHARQRLATRQVRLSQSDVQRIAEGVDRAAAKGARESLVLLNRLALIVNVPNRTVLTALDTQRLREGVVTNIDSTVFV